MPFIIVPLQQLCSVRIGGSDGGSNTLMVERHLASVIEDEIADVMLTVDEDVVKLVAAEF